MRKHARNAIEGRTVRIARWMRELRRASQCSANICAERAPIAVRMAREALRYGAETTVREGLEIERRNFYLLFDTEDQKEGMRAFIEKRKPDYKGR